jgi:hypothetical protein
MKSPKSKQDLIETVYKQIELDIHCGSGQFTSVVHNVSRF